MSATLGGLRQYLRIATQFVRIGLIRKSQFRVEFLGQVVMDAIWYTSHVLSFEILYGYEQIREIAGWSAPEIRVFLAFVFVSDAFMMMWLGQGWMLGRELKDGKLDPYRVRPARTVFLYFFQRFSVEACFNMALALAYFGWALAQAGAVLSGWSWLVVPWAVLLSFWGRAVLTVLFTIWEFYFLHSDMGNLMQQVATAPAEKPLDIWDRRVRAFFLHALPVGVLSHIPAGMVLGKLGLGASLLHTAWLVLFGLGVVRLWERGFRRYESAMS